MLVVSTNQPLPVPAERAQGQGPVSSNYNNKHHINQVLKAQRAIQRGVISAAMEVVNCLDVNGDSMESAHGWDVKVGDTSMEEMRGAGFAGSVSPFRGRDRTAVDIDVCPEREMSGAPQPSLP